ncbi:MAG: hypothetical protein ACRC7N_02900 [Clostridium sp.]
MKKTIKIILLILLLFIIPLIMPTIALLTGVISRTLITTVIALITIALVVIHFKKKKKVLAIYFLILGVIIGSSAFISITLNNIIFEGKKLSFSERLEIMNDIDSGKITVEELTIKYVGDKKISQYDLKTVKGNKTFYYRSNGYNPEKSIKFIDEILGQSMESFGTYLEYYNEKPCEIILSEFYNGDLRGQVGVTNQVEIGMYEEYIDGGKLSNKGLEVYKETIIHEYIHFISNLYLREDGIPKEIPSWFTEGVSTYVVNEICNIDDERGEIVPLDLRKPLDSSTIRSKDFYIASSRIIREIYKEVGTEGVVKILKLYNEMEFDQALKEVTGKQLEDYYYVFKG